MLMMQEQSSSRTHNICRCGRKAEAIVGSRDFHIGTRKITLHHVPHFYCSYCDVASFRSDQDIDGALRYAYKEQLDSVDWRQFEQL